MVIMSFMCYNCSNTNPDLCKCKSNKDIYYSKDISK